MGSRIGTTVAPGRRCHWRAAYRDHIDAYLYPDVRLQRGEKDGWNDLCQGTGHLLMCLTDGDVHIPLTRIRCFIHLPVCL